MRRLLDDHFLSALDVQSALHRLADALTGEVEERVVGRIGSRNLYACGNVIPTECEALDGTARSGCLEVSLVGTEVDGAVGELVETDLAVELA